MHTFGLKELNFMPPSSVSRTSRGELLEIGLRLSLRGEVGLLDPSLQDKNELRLSSNGQKGSEIDKTCRDESPFFGDVG